MTKFLIINTSFFGDILLTDSLCRNIKAAYPESQLTFIANKPFIDAARYLSGVDEVIGYDKVKEHHGICGAWRFYHQYKEHFADGFAAAFVVYGNERGIVLAHLFGAKKVYAEQHNAFRLLLTNGKIDYHGKAGVQERNAILFEEYSKIACKNIPMLYTPPRGSITEAVTLLSKNGITDQQKTICLCTVSKKKEKDMPLPVCAHLIIKLSKAGYCVILLGNGKRALDYSHELSKYTKAYTDLVNATTIPQLAAVIKLSRCLISVDTGTMHLGLALSIPVLALFYIADKKHLAKWAPDTSLYRTIILTAKDCTYENILTAAEKLITTNP